jgi:hypothetical protein
MEAFQQRVVEEQKELETRLIALSAFIGTDNFLKLDAEDRDLLHLQHDAMDTLNDILVRRIHRFGARS